MPLFQLEDGTTQDVHESQIEDFLKVNKNAVEYTEQGNKVEKQTDSAITAQVESSNMGSSSEDSFSAFPAPNPFGDKTDEEVSDIINTQKNSLHDAEDFNTGELKFDHIDELEFKNDLLSTNFTNREETIVPKLKSKYKYDKLGNESNIVFEESGATNNVSILLPGNQYPQSFPLPKGENEDEANKAYIDIVQYIENGSEKKWEFSTEVQEEYDNLFKHQNYAKSKDGEEPVYYDNDDPILRNTNTAYGIDVSFDGNLAKKANALFASDNVEFEEQKIFKNAVKVTLENGNNQIFNLGNLSKARELIGNFIKTDSKGYINTDVYREAEERISNYANQIINKHMENPLDYADPNEFDDLVKKVMLGTGSAGVQQLFLADDEKVKELERSDKEKLIRNIIQQRVNEAEDKYTNISVTNEVLRLKEGGANGQQVIEGLEATTRSSFTGSKELKSVKNKIFDINKELQDNVDNESPEWKARLAKINGENKDGVLYQLNALRADIEGREGHVYGTFIDPATGFTVAKQNSENSLVDLQPEIENKTQEIQGKGLSYRDVKKNWLSAKLAHSNAAYKWQNKKYLFQVDKNEIQSFLKSDIGKKARPGEKGGFYLTDAEASRTGFNVNLENDVDYKFRKQFLNNATIEAKSYDKIYALGETLMDQETQSFGGALLQGLTESIGYGPEVSTDEYRSNFADIMTEDFGLDLTHLEEEFSKVSFIETTGRALGGIPKLTLDFWVANKAVAAMGAVTTINTMVQSLKASKYVIKTANGVTRVDKAGLIKMMKKTADGRKLLKNRSITPAADDVKVGNFTFKNSATKNTDDAISQWRVGRGPKAKITKGRPFTVEKVKASFGDQAKAQGILSLIEGVKMEIAMQDPLNLNSDMDVPIGSSFATGVGFGLVGGVIPWTKMFTGMGGQKAGPFKGMYDYLVASPISFVAGARLGELTNQVVDDMMGKKTWQNFMNEHYGDYDEVMKHNITDLIMGFAMKAGHYKKFDFASEKRLTRVRNSEKAKLDNLFEKDSISGEMRLKKGMQEKAQKHYDLINMAERRLVEIHDTMDWIDPIQGPLMMQEAILATAKGAKVKGITKVFYENNMSQNMSFRKVKAGEKLHDGTIAGAKGAYEFVFNPKKVNPGLAPHELGHFGLEHLFGKDVMFNGKFVDGLGSVMKKIKTVGVDPKTGESKEMNLFDAFISKGVWKADGSSKVPDYSRQGGGKQLKHEEMFTFLGEFLAREGNLKKVRETYGFDRLAGFLENVLSKNFEQKTNLNTEKEIVEWFSEYLTTVGKQKSAIKDLKNLERFVSRTKTENERKRRIEWEKENGQGETVEKRSESLTKDLKELEAQLKNNPFLPMLRAGEITIEEYKENVKELDALIKKKRKVLADMPKEENIFQGGIDGFAMKDGVMMTESQWNARGGGKDQALIELAKEGGLFDPLLTSGLRFPFQGRSREVFLGDVKFGIEGAGKKVKATGENKMTFITKGVYGVIENFNKNKWGTKEQNDGLSGWINSQYQFRRGDVNDYYKKNPVGKSLDAPIKGGGSFGDMLEGKPDPNIGTFDMKDQGREWVSNKKGSFEEVVDFNGNRRIKNELPIDSKVFNGKGGWKEIINKEIKNIENVENVGFKGLDGKAIDLVHQMMGIKLSPSQKTKPNDLGETNLKNAQEYIDGIWNQPRMQEKVLESGKTKKEQMVDNNGNPEFRKINNAEVIADFMPEATIKFDKGVSDKLQGTSSYARLGTLSELFHKATVKNYKPYELKKLGYEVNPTPNADGSWRVASGPGGQIFIRGKSKGQKITSSDIKEFVGIKDGVYTPLSKNRSLAGRVRRIAEIIDKVVTNQTQREAVIENPNTIPKQSLARFLLNTKAGNSRIAYSESLEKFTLEQKKEFFKGINTPEFSFVYSSYLEKTQKNPLGKALRDYFTGLGVKSTFSTNFIKEMRAELMKTGKQLETKLSLEGVNGKVEALKVRVASKLMQEGSLNAIEKRLSLEQTDVPFLFDPKGGIKLAQSLDKLLMERFEKLKGKGWYEAIMLLSNTSGTGLGGQRKAIYRTAEEARALAESIETSGIYKEISRPNSNMVGIKSDLMKYVGLLKGGAEFNMVNAKKAHEFGEINKKNLKEIVEVLRELYSEKTSEIDHRHVRAFLEVAGGPMTGILRKSGSLAVLPKGSPKELFKIWPERIKSLDKNGNVKKDDKGNDVYESGWVLEHIIPTQFVKARIYDYILSGTKQSKEAMDLTIRDYHTTFIPKVLDKMVNRLYLSELAPEYLPGMDALEWRYYRNAHPSDFNIALTNFVKNKTYDINPTFTHSQVQARASVIKKANARLFGSVGLEKAVENRLNSEAQKFSKSLDKAIRLGRKLKKKSRGMSTFDFDETVGFSENFVFATKGKLKKKIASNEWPFVGDKLLAEGWKMDFTDFNKVTDGKPGPLMQKMKNQIKKFGPENVFILTARAKESQQAIHEYLKSEGINIPLKNITGLGNSTGEAKAMWMLEKFAEGYNDMYFVDDAMPNVKAVKDVLSQLDIKSKVQQAVVKYSEDLNEGINKILEHSLGIKKEKKFSKSEGKFRGKDKKRRKFFIPDSAADMELLMEPLYGKGKQGIANKKWMEENLFKKWERGTNDLNSARQAVITDYMALRKQNKAVVKSLPESIEGSSFTVDSAVRVYIWSKNGLKAPDLAETSRKKLVEYVEKNPELQAFAEKISKLTKIETGLSQPKETWWSETLASEIQNIGKTVDRSKYIADWIEAKDIVLSTENLNKMEAELGPKWREAVDLMLDRMQTGRSRGKNLGRIGNSVMNYLNGSVGAIMNLNTRSAVLQLISTVNFINHAENNPFQAARAFANQPQYWKDFMYIMNSDMLKQRRDGLKINVTEAELAAAVNGKGNKASQALSWILKQGYLPTKIADSFAISSGGATYYRNRIRMYEKKGVLVDGELSFDKKTIEKIAFEDFQAIAEKTQQSSREDLLSQQQVSFEGRLLLPFANTPMQMNRIMMKELLDLSKGRFEGVVGENSLTNKVSKIGYYGFVQSAIFAGLQSGYFALIANTDEEPAIKEKKMRAYNTIFDSFLRGMGITGVVASGIKNALIAFKKENDKGWNGDFSEPGEALLNMSPTIGSKFSKFDAAGNTYKYNKKEILKKGFSLDNTRGIEALTQVIEAATNAPVNRFWKKHDNIQHALDDQYENWQRVQLWLGSTPYDVGIKRNIKKKKSKKTYKPTMSL